MRKTLRCLSLAAALGLALAASIGCAASHHAAGHPQAVSYDRPGFVTQVEDGRLWVFRAGSKELEEFQAKGEPAKQVVRPGAGPGRITLKGPDAETLDAYLAAPAN
jgi:hypothetical protein